MIVWIEYQNFELNSNQILNSSQVSYLYWNLNLDFYQFISRAEYCLSELKFLYSATGIIDNAKQEILKGLFRMSISIEKLKCNYKWFNWSDYTIN